MTGQAETLAGLIDRAFADSGPLSRAFSVRGRAFRRSPSQVDYAHAVARTFCTGAGAVSLIEAGGGTGKSLGYLVPLALFCAMHAVRGLVAVATPATADQLGRSELAIAAEAAFDLTRKRLIFARRYAAQDFLSRSKIAFLQRAVGEANTELRGVLASLRAFCDDSGLLPDWVRDNGLLPVTLDPRDVTLTTPQDFDSDKYTAHLANAGEADILVVPQGLLARHLRTGSKLADTFGCAVVDEGDEWPDTLARTTVMHVSTLDLVPSPALDAFVALAGRMACEYPRQSFLRLSDTRVMDVRIEAGKLAASIGGLERFVAACDEPNGPDRPLITWSPVATAPAFEVHPAVAPGMGELPSGLDSLCITAASFEDRPAFRRAIGRDVDASHLDGAFTPRRFGSLSFNLSHPSAPKPSVPFPAAKAVTPAPGGRDPAWFDHVEEVCVRVAEFRQRALVLTCNFAETVELAQRLRGRGVMQVIEHARGERLSESLSAFRARSDGLLIAPNMWEGVDLPGLVRHLVVTRLPIASRHSPAMQIEAERLRAEGLGEDDVTLRVFDILSQRARRKLAHGIGRAVRQAGDDAQVWITDPRFPLPDSLTGNARLHLPANIPVFRDFVRCIPQRFRAGLLATYPASTLIEVETRIHTAAAPKRKGRSRRA